MKPINSNFELKKIGDEEFIVINLSVENIARIPLQILYYKGHGIKNFLLNYDSNNFNVPISKVLSKIKVDNLLTLMGDYNLRIAFSGFPRCIYERNILRPGLRWDYEGKVMFFKQEGDNLEKLDTCENCSFNSDCSGINSDYLKKYGIEEFKSLLSNESFYELNFEHLERFTSPELKQTALRILQDYRQDKFYMRKRFVFVKSYPDNLEESAKERFVYYIYNREDDFENTYTLLKEFFDFDFLFGIVNYLKKSNQIVLSFGLMGDSRVRKTLYFNIDSLDDTQIFELENKFGIEIDTENIWGVGIDFKGDAISYKVYHEYEKIKTQDIKDFLSDFVFEDKRFALKFSNSLVKPINSVLFDYKYKEGQIYSKRIDISLQYNNFRLNQFALLFNINMGYFEDKELYTLSIEISRGKPEKINFYYVLKQPEPEQDEDKVYVRKSYSYL